MKVTVPKAPFGVKLRDTPVEYRVLLRLCHIATAQKVPGVKNPKGLVNLPALAEELEAPLPEVMAAVTAIMQAGRADLVRAITPVEFEFTVPGILRDRLRQMTNSYTKHLEKCRVRKERLALNPPRVPRVKGPPALVGPFPYTPISREERLPHMKSAAALAKKMSRPHLQTRIANCIARLGKKEVTALVKEALATFKEGSLTQHFFNLYGSRRDVLVPKDNECAA